MVKEQFPVVPHNMTHVDYVLTDAFTPSLSQMGDSSGPLSAMEIYYIYKLCESHVVLKNSSIRLL